MPFLILGNKIDLPNSVSEEELKEQMGIYKTTGKNNANKESGMRPIEVFMCSIISRSGYGPALKWLANLV